MSAWQGSRTSLCRGLHSLQKAYFTALKQKRPTHCSPEIYSPPGNSRAVTSSFHFLISVLLDCPGSISK